MQLLFLFFTQSEGGAPGYLSRRGEEAAANLAESLCGFLANGLNLDLSHGAGARAESLEQDLRWRAYRSADVLSAAVVASLSLFNDCLLMSGSSERSLKTAEFLAQSLALPVCVDARIDHASDDPKSPGSLRDAVSELLLVTLPKANPPKAALIGTTLSSLLDWVRPRMDEDKFHSLAQVLGKVTEGGLLPAVFTCGFVSDDSGTTHWIFD